MVLSIKEGLVECATVCVKSVVILLGLSEPVEAEGILPQVVIPPGFDVRW